MAKKIEEIEREIKKIEAHLAQIHNNKVVSTLDKNIQETTISLLKKVIEDLRQQQVKLAKLEFQER